MSIPKREEEQQNTTSWPLFTEQKIGTLLRAEEQDDDQEIKKIFAGAIKSVLLKKPVGVKCGIPVGEIPGGDWCRNKCDSECPFQPKATKYVRL